MSNIILKTDIIPYLQTRLILDLCNIVVEYLHDHCILQEFKIDDDIHTYAIVGKRSSGKSTLAKHIAKQYNCETILFSADVSENWLPPQQIYRNLYQIDSFIEDLKQHARQIKSKIVVIFDDMCDVKILQLIQNARHHNIIVIITSQSNNRFYGADCLFVNNTMCSEYIAMHIERNIPIRVINNIMCDLWHSWIVLHNNVLSYYGRNS